MSTEMTQWIMDTMISMTLLMAFVLLIRKPVSHYFGPKIAYALWALPAARLFMPILTLEAPAPAETAAPMAASGASFSELASAVPTEAVVSGTLASIDWLFVALIIWAGGAGMLFISKLASYIRSAKISSRMVILVGKHDNIRILETAAVGGPLAFGLFQKYIAVPTDFFRNYSPAERALALEHEIAHHESGDLFANFAGLLVLSLHWFNPIAWFAWVAFREDQETACDARILQKSGQEVRAIYGRTIAKSASRHQLGLASPLNQKDKIKGRLKMLGSSEKSGFRKKLGMLMVGASTVVALPATATVVYIEADDASAAHIESRDDGVHVKSAGTSVDVGDNGVLVTEKTKKGYKYTVSNKRGTFEFQSKRKLKKSEIDKKLGKMVPSFKKLSAPQAPAAPVPPEPPAIAGDEKAVNITMLNGSKDFANDKQYVHRIKHDGRTIQPDTQFLPAVQPVQQTEPPEQSGEMSERDRLLYEIAKYDPQLALQLEANMRQRTVERLNILKKVYDMAIPQLVNVKNNEQWKALRAYFEAILAQHGMSFSDAVPENMPSPEEMEKLLQFCSIED